MGRLSGKNLEFFAKHYESFKEAYRTQIYFCFDSKANGKSAFTMLKTVYASECNYNAYGIDHRDFYLGFTSKATRDWVMQDIESSLSAYQEAHGNDPVEEITEDITITEVQGAQANKDWTTYLILGAAVAVILLLLWDNKKK